MVPAAFHTALIFTLAFVLAKHWKAAKSKLFWLAFALHVTAGIGVGLIYIYYYSANDTWFFFEDAKTLSQLAGVDLLSYCRALADFSDVMTADLVTQDFRSMVFVKILSLVSLLTGDNYWISTAYFSLLSFASSWFLFRRVTIYFEKAHTAAALSFLIFPSVVFWSSGIEKETLTVSAIYFLAGLFLQLSFRQKPSPVHWAIAVLAAFVLWSLKYYWAGVFFVAVGAGVIVNYLSVRHEAIKGRLTLAYLVCFVLVAFGVSFLHPNFYMNRLLEVVVANHDAFAALSSDQTLIHFYDLHPTVGSIAINAPWALVSGVFRPWVGEGQGLLGLAASLENFFILVLTVSAVWGYRTNVRKPVGILFLATMSYCIVLCTFLTLSTPNLGTLSRYRVGFLPFLIFMLAYRNPRIDFIAKKFKG